MIIIRKAARTIGFMSVLPDVIPFVPFVVTFRLSFASIMKAYLKTGIPFIPMYRVFIDCPNCNEESSILFMYQRLYGHDIYEVEKAFCDCTVGILKENHHRECRLRALRLILDIQPVNQ